MRYLFFALLLVPISVAAEPVSIRTGEHDTFSRFVFTIGEGTGWDIEPVKGGVILNLVGRTDGFDTSTVFERIPRNRVARVAQPGANQLYLELDCVCSADAFLWKSDQLVVDIVDGDEFLQPLPAGTENSTAALTRPIQILPDTPQALPNLLALRQAGFPFAPAPTPTLEQPDMAIGEGTNTEEKQGIRETESALLEGLARAASQGFLDANITQTEESTPPTEVPIVETPPSLPPSFIPHPGIGITTALDRELAMVGAAIGQGIEPSCLPPDMFQLTEWGGDAAFHTQVAELADALAGEFGAEPREAQEDLARLYLHFGFGLEAMTILSADTAQSQDRIVMAQLAGLIDGYEGDYGLIAAQAGCATPAALWAFLAKPEDVNEESRNNILQTLFALPTSVRGHIAPRVSRAFLDIGDPETAERVLQAGADVAILENHDAAATRAMIAESLDQPETAMSVLAEQAANNPRTSPASLIRLIELGIENGTPTAEADLVLAAAMRQEFRETPIALELALAEATGRTQLGQYQQALDLVEDQESDAAMQVLNTIYSGLTQDSDTATFLDFAFSDEPMGLTPETQNAMATRLISVGFPERAMAFLNGPAQREAAAERRYLRADAAIGAAKYADALDAMLGLTSPRANDLRLQAYVGLGEHRAALESSNLEGPNATLEFRAGAWERLSEDEDPVLSSFAQSVLEQPADGPAVTLADRRAILAQSQESRQAIEGLLLRFDASSTQD